jgi:hypothetical protein
MLVTYWKQLAVVDNSLQFFVGHANRGCINFLAWAFEYRSFAVAARKRGAPARDAGTCGTLLN